MASAYDFPGLYDYLTRFSGQDEVLAQVARETGELPDAEMLSRADQGGLLTLLALMLDARVAIEVGTFTGYGAICIARGLAADGHLTCFEVSEEYAEISRRNIARAGLDDRVTVQLGPADDGARRGSRTSRTSTSPTSTPTRPATRPTTTRSSRGCAPAACWCSTTRCCAAACSTRRTSAAR